MALIESTGEHWNSPIEVVERMATDNELPFERAVQDEIALVVNGRLTDYQVSFTWMHEIEVLHLACAFEMKVPEPRSPEVQQLIVTINEQLWIGHFDVWMQSGMIMFRHALLLVGGGGLSAGSARRCSAARSTRANAITRRFNSWSGPGNRRARPSMPSCSIRAAKHSSTRQRSQLSVARTVVYTRAQTLAGLI